MIDIPEFRAVVGGEEADQLVSASRSSDEGDSAAAMRRCFAAMMRRDQDTVRTQLANLVKRVRALGM